MDGAYIDTIMLNNSIEKLKMLNSEQLEILNSINNSFKAMAENYKSTNTHKITDVVNSNIGNADILINNQSLYAKYLEGVLEDYELTGRKVATMFNDINGEM